MSFLLSYIMIKYFFTDLRQKLIMIFKNLDKVLWGPTDRKIIGAKRES